MEKMSSECVLETGCLSLNKQGEELCGDHVEMVKKDNGDRLIVLADGLGSGVRANILSTLTSSMLSTMIDGGLSLRESVSSLARTLPVAPDRGNLAYSTFTIVRASLDNLVIYNYDNPEPILLREGKELKIDWVSAELEGKKIFFAALPFKEGDTLVLVSDGAVYAGVGATLNFGWTRKEIARYLEGVANPSVSSKNLAKILVDRCLNLYEGKPGDDTTAVVLRKRAISRCNILVGPPTNSDDDNKVLSSFFAENGKHIVCGGTSAQLASRYLQTPVVASLGYLDKKIPPISQIKGVDLVTEGIVTLNRLVEIGKDYLANDDLYFDWVYKQDGASLLAKALYEEATDISFDVGCAVNPAHQDPRFNISISTKLQLVDELTKLLKQMDKRVHVAYF
jgi:hypothetical protein